MSPGGPDETHPEASVPRPPAARRASLREQDAVWAEFLELATTVIDSLDKCAQAICDARYDLIPALKAGEVDSDRREVVLEQECLRVIARYEPVAIDLRRMVTVLKANRDWERIADLALRVARRSRKLSRKFVDVPVPEGLKALAQGVLEQVRRAYDALARADADVARAVIAGDAAIDREYRALRGELKRNLNERANRLDAWLILLNNARNLERIGDHAVGIAQSAVYLKEGIIIRHSHTDPSSSSTS